MDAWFPVALSGLRVDMIVWHVACYYAAHTQGAAVFLEPLTAIFGTATKVRLLRALTPLGRPVSGREAARRAGVSHIAQQALEELAESGVLHRDHAGRQYLYQFNRDHVLAPVIEHAFQEEREYARRVFDRLKEILDEAGPVESAALFGSAPRGDDRPGSDFDLLVLVQDERETGPMHEALGHAFPEIDRVFGLHMSPVVLTIERFRNLHSEGDPLAGDVLSESRLVYGRPISEVVDDQA